MPTIDPQGPWTPYPNPMPFPQPIVPSQPIVKPWNPLERQGIGRLPLQGNVMPAKNTTTVTALGFEVAITLPQNLTAESAKKLAELLETLEGMSDD